MRATTVVDLRSDTVTKPTPAMRRAMAEAEVGDDVYGEDPTVNLLEAMAADVFKREAALLLPTGTMGNQAAIKIHTQPGQEIICEERAHIFNWEMATLASFSGCLVRPVRSADGSGRLTWADVQPAIAPKIYYRAQTGLIVLENTHNMAGGTATPAGLMHEVCGNARERGIPVHLDGARIFNAAAALGVSVAELTAPVDSVMFCLSKALGAPVGSMLVGSKQFIEQARIHRKALGGGMRQAGVLAAAGIIALEETPRLLAQDHANARLLAEGTEKLTGIKLDATRVETNIVIFEVGRDRMTAAELITKLAEEKILASAISPQQVRFVTHYDVDRAGCERVVDVMRSIFA